MGAKILPEMLCVLTMGLVPGNWNCWWFCLLCHAANKLLQHYHTLYFWRKKSSSVFLCVENKLSHSMRTDGQICDRCALTGSVIIHDIRAKILPEMLWLFAVCWPWGLSLVTETVGGFACFVSSM
jgi:hypothetical protein